MAKSTVAVRFLGDTAQLKSAVSEVDSKMGGLGAKLGSVGTLAAGGMAAAGAAVIGFAAKSADTFSRVGGEVNKLIRYTGATAEEASRLRFAGDEAGVGVDTMTKSLGLLSKGLATTKLDKLGFDFKDASGKAKPLNDDLLQIAARFEKMPNGAEKTALAMKLFGKAGADMIPFLNRGAEGIRELEKESDKYGNTLSQKDLNAVKESTKNHRLFSAAMEGLQIQVGRYVLPIMTKFTSFLATNMPTAINGVRTVMEALAPAFQVIGSVISDVMGDISLFVNTLRTGFTEDEGTPIENVALKIRAAFQAIVSWFQQNWPQIQSTVEGVMNAISTVIQVNVAVIQGIWNIFGDNIMSAIRRVWPPIQQIVQGVMEVIHGVIQTITALIHGDWSGAWDGIKMILSGAWDAMQGIVKTAFEYIRLGISLALDAVGQLFKAGWNALVDFLASIPGRFIGALQALGGMLRNLASNAVGMFKSAASSAFDNTVSFVSGIPGRILAALGDVGRLLFDAGKKIIGGLIDGIKSAIGGVKDVVGGIAGKIVSWKGPPDYDSVLLVDNGRRIISGLIAGLSDQRSLKDLLSQMSAMISGQFDSVDLALPSLASAGALGSGGGFSAGVSASGSGGGDLHVHLMLDAQELAQAILPGFRAAQDQLGRRNGVQVAF